MHYLLTVTSHYLHLTTNYYKPTYYLIISDWNSKVSHSYLVVSGLMA